MAFQILGILLCLLVHILSGLELVARLAERLQVLLPIFAAIAERLYVIGIPASPNEYNPAFHASVLVSSELPQSDARGDRRVWRLADPFRD